VIDKVPERNSAEEGTRVRRKSDKARQSARREGFLALAKGISSKIGRCPSRLLFGHTKLGTKRSRLGLFE
jgi:hypothetical protein